MPNPTWKLETLLFNDRKKRYTRLNRAQYCVVTFDLSPSEGRQAVYGRVRKRLEDFVGNGNVVRAIKQLYLVKSDYALADIRSEMLTLLHRGDSVVVARLQPGDACHLVKPAANKAATAFFAELEKDEGI